MLDKYGLVGNPVQHSISPKIHGLFAQQTHQAINYEKFLVPVDEFQNTIKKFQQQGFKGLNVTLPFKQQAFELCDEVSQRAKLAGAVNTLMFKEDGKIFGDNTDGLGMIKDIRDNHHFGLTEKSVLLIGAGGAARGAIKPILDEDPTSLTLTNRTPSKAQTLAQEFNKALNVRIITRDFNELAQSYDCIINATSISLSNHGKKFPLDAKIIKATSCCYDMMYGGQTIFMKWAKEGGATLILDGFGMLVEQAAESFMLWRGIRPNTKLKSIYDVYKK